MGPHTVVKYWSILLILILVLGQNGFESLNRQAGLIVNICKEKGDRN